MENLNQIRVLIAPLNWGLGHATRCVPLINECLRRGWFVVLASDGRSGAFLKETFPELPYEELPSYNITYPENAFGMAFKMLAGLPAVLKTIRNEHLCLGKLILKYKINLVISDNRYGLWSDSAYTVFMTHQLTLHIPAPFSWARNPVFALMNRYYSRFNECWVPDFEGSENLSGALSHGKKPANTFFIGPLSRLRKITPDDALKAGPLAVLAIVSGPEPQRTLFEKLILKQLEALPEKSVLLRGMPGSTAEEQVSSHILMKSHVPGEELQALAAGATLIVARPGYSTVMDLCVLGRTALLIPTPGQTEQEYLAAYLGAKGLFLMASQKSFNICDALEAVRQSNTMTGFSDSDKATSPGPHFDRIEHNVGKMFNFAP